MGLDAVDVGGEVDVEVELVNVLGFVLLRSWFLESVDRFLLFFFQCRLGHRRLYGHIPSLTPDATRETDGESEEEGTAS